MKQIMFFILFPLVVLFISSCAIEPAGIDSIEDAERVANIVFQATYIGETECQGSIDPPNCIVLDFPNGGTIEVCLADKKVLSGSQFYEGLTFTTGLIFTLGFNNVEVTCPETDQEYTLNGDLAFYGSFSSGESIDIVFVLYGSVDIDGNDISDTAEMDVQYTGHVESSGDKVVISGNIQGTVNEYEITDMDWEYTIPL